MYFRGRSTRNIDPKARLMLPPDFRESLIARHAAYLKAQNTAGINETGYAEQAGQIGGSEANGCILPPEQAGSLVQVAAKCVLTTYDTCLVAFPWEDWLDLENKFARLPNPSPEVRAFRRLFLGGAEVQEADAQGRIRLSQDHREYARIEKDVVLMGLVNRFEIWNPQMLRNSLENHDISRVTEELAHSGIDFQL